MALGRRARRGESEATIDISPLIDVVFILLIFFMVSTTFVKDAKLDIERPGASSGTAPDTRSLRVYIDRHQAVYVDNLPVKPWMLQSRVREALSNGASTSVLVVTDRSVTAQQLIEVIDQIRLAGAQDVGVITDREEG